MVFRGNKGWLGLELGTHTITLAQAERGPFGVRTCASAVVEPGAEGNSTADASAPGTTWESQDIVDTLATDPGFSGRRAACVLPMHLTEMNILTMPPAPEAERRAMIAYELSSVFPNDSEEREFDFWVTDSPGSTAVGNGGTDTPDGESVNVLSVRRPLVSDLVRRLSRAGLRCQAIDCLPFALARAVHLAYDSGGNVPVGAVHWGGVSGTLCVVSGRGPQFTRHLRNCGVGSLAGKVSRALGLSEDEATRVLAEHGLPDPDCREPGRREIQQAVADVTSQELNELANELNKTISYVRLRHPELTPERLCLFGEGARVKNASLYIARKVGLATDVWRLPIAEDRDGRQAQGPQGPLGAAVALSTLAWT
ncbi:MAG: pilus assembly protein PilM [Planctomycetes bacterium]|nr:pilus assembly protein PilM [Planctomycetota bacterium]